MTFDGRIEAQIIVPAGVTVSATNSGGGPTSVAIPAGTYYPTALLAAIATALQSGRAPSSGSWTAALSTGASGTGQVSLNCTGTWSLTWTSTLLRDLLGFTANIVSVSAAQTGPKQMHGVWRPDDPLMADDDPGRAPVMTDFRATVNGQGGSYAMVGVARYQKTNLRWQAVPIAQVWESKTVVANSSLETFLNDAQLNRGHAWFGVGSLIQIYDHTGSLVGLDANGGVGMTTGWSMPDISGMGLPLLRRYDANGWSGLWTVTIPQILSSG